MILDNRVSTSKDLNSNSLPQVRKQDSVKSMKFLE